MSSFAPINHSRAQNFTLHSNLWRYHEKTRGKSQISLSHLLTDPVYTRGRVYIIQKSAVNFLAGSPIRERTVVARVNYNVPREERQLYYTSHELRFTTRPFAESCLAIDQPVTRDDSSISNNRHKLNQGFF